MYVFKSNKYDLNQKNYSIKFELFLRSIYILFHLLNKIIKSKYGFILHEKIGRLAVMHPVKKRDKLFVFTCNTLEF